MGFPFVLFQGNLFDFLRLTGWRGSKVLYFGDHLYSDLAVSLTGFSHQMLFLIKISDMKSTSVTLSCWTIGNITTGKLIKYIQTTFIVTPAHMHLVKQIFIGLFVYLRH